MTLFRFFAVLAIASTVAGPAWATTPASRREFANGAQPQLTIGSNGRVWLAYGRTGDAPAAAAEGHQHKGHGPQARSGEVFVAYSDDGGSTFSEPVKAASVPQLMLGNRRGPRIVAHGSRLTLSMVTDELVAFTSSDEGKTWSGPVKINDVPTSAREGLHDLAAAPDGQVFATWLDMRNGKMELWGASSKDGGRTWAKNQQVYRSPDKSICECCHPSALFDADGNLAIMWRNSIGGSRDMWMTTRARGATQFTAARKLGDGTWKLNACPMDGGRIVALGGGHFGAVWQRNGEVFMSGGQGQEQSLGKGKQPVAVRTTRDAPPVVIWQQGNDLVSLTGVSDSPPIKQASDARFPSLIALPGGKGALLAYERGAKGATSVVVERL